MEQLFEKIDIEGLTADCVGRETKAMKTVYSQKLNKIIKSKKSGAEVNDFFTCQKLVWFDFFR